jgi:uncharacterized 2Fe-2S/4Fe-4S cluster protein (DUF4445 family)
MICDKFDIAAMRKNSARFYEINIAIGLMYFDESLERAYEKRRGLKENSISISKMLNDALRLINRSQDIWLDIEQKNAKEIFFYETQED